MKRCRILGLVSSPLIASILALGLLACGDGSSGSKPDAATDSAGQKTDGAGSTTDGSSTPDTTVKPADAGTTVADAKGNTDTNMSCPAIAKPLPAGTKPLPAAGNAVASTPTRPQLTAAFADSKVTVKNILGKGGQMINTDAGTAMPADAGANDAPMAMTDAAATDATDNQNANAADAGNASTATGPVPFVFQLNDDWDPQTNGIGDVATFTPTFVVAEDGSGTHAKLTDALNAVSGIAASETCSRVYIQVKPGKYREKPDVPSKASAPMITVYSLESDASKTVIDYDSSVPGTDGSMSTSFTMQVRAKTGFQMKNITIQNSYVPGTLDGADQGAVALLVQTDRSQFENVRILGNVSTLYIKSVDIYTVARSYFRDCYIEGDKDFIRGRGTAVFDQCEIKYKGNRLASDRVIAYPSTVVNAPFGFVFLGCTFSADPGVTDVALGHQWFEGGNAPVVGKMIVRNSTLGAHIAAKPWVPGGASDRTSTPQIAGDGASPIVVYSSDDYFTPATAPATEYYLAEYGNTTK